MRVQNFVAVTPVMSWRLRNSEVSNVTRESNKQQESASRRARSRVWLQLSRDVGRGVSQAVPTPSSHWQWLDFVFLMARAQRLWLRMARPLRIFMF